MSTRPKGTHAMRGTRVVVDEDIAREHADHLNPEDPAKRDPLPPVYVSVDPLPPAVYVSVDDDGVPHEVEVSRALAHGTCTWGQPRRIARYVLDTSYAVEEHEEGKYEGEL